MTIAPSRILAAAVHRASVSRITPPRVREALAELLERIEEVRPDDLEVVVAHLASGRDARVVADVENAVRTAIYFADHDRGASVITRGDGEEVARR